MKRILLAFALVAFAATASPAAPLPGHPGARQPLPAENPYQLQKPAVPRVRPAPPPGFHQPAPLPGSYSKPVPPQGSLRQPAPLPGAYQKPVPPRDAFHHAPLRGNVMSKVYHARDCEYYNSKAKKMEFASAREAERAGFRACKICEGKEGVATQKKQHRREQLHHKAHLHGNPVTKTLHGPSCKFYNSKSSTERFDSLEQARRHGYTLCTVCGGK